MQITAIQQQQAPSARDKRDDGPPARAGTGRRYELEGDARPGDVLALAGGALVCDANGNGVIDGFDALVGDGPAAGTRGLLVDVRG
jgi:hypothetical protein